jgi:hypothetical protein
MFVVLAWLSSLRLLPYFWLLAICKKPQIRNQMPGNKNSVEFTTPPPSINRSVPNVTGGSIPVPAVPLRQSRRFDSEGRPTITPTQLSSIRDTARCTSQSGESGNAQSFTTFDVDRKRRGQEYDFAEAYASKLPIMSPNKKKGHSTKATASTPQDGAPKSPMKDNDTHKDDAPTATEEERFCYCDTTEKQARDKEDWLECGGCNGWYHLRCTGLSIEEEEAGRSLKLPGGGRIALDEEATPWYCIRCWEQHKERSTPFDEVDDLEEKAFRLGITIRDDVTTQTFARQLKKYVSRMFEVVGDETLVKSLLDSRPRPYPTTKPMDPKACHKLALWGRRFEIQQLLVDVDKCDCCGIVMPFAADDWLQNKGIEGNSHFRRLHLLKKYKSYRIFKCDCADVCKGGQFWCLRRPTHRDAFIESHGYNPLDATGDDDDDGSDGQENDCTTNSHVLCDRCYDEACGSKLKERRKFCFVIQRVAFSNSLYNITSQRR